MRSSIDIGSRDQGKATCTITDDGNKETNTHADKYENQEECSEKPRLVRKKPVVCIVMGMAGSGKTTLLQRLHLHTTEKGIRSYFINLDPAVRQV